MSRIGAVSFFAVAVMITGTVHGDAGFDHTSKYAGQEIREIKSLSAEDVDELRNGKGWGLAKAAELNGVPGPVHLLEMKSEIQLSEKQVEQLTGLYEEMKSRAIYQGKRLIALEKELDEAFASGSIDEERLRDLLGKISDVYGKLRFTHLSAHLKTPAIITPGQRQRYNELRGYGSDDPCKNIPKGHDPKLWKRHHNCE